MQLHTLQTLVSQTAGKATAPLQPNPRPALNSKEDFRKWCVNPTTQHIFYSAWEGVNPGLRISKSNPAKLLHGFVADFDAAITDQMILDVATSGGILPMWSTRTYSGGARLVWQFEEPLLMDNHILAERVMKTLVKELKVKKLLPGFDEASTESSQYFEAGTDWQPVAGAMPIPVDLVGLWTLDSANSKITQQSGLEIPIEEIAAEVERQFPGRWTGDFVVGSRGPLFWVPDGIQRVGCQVGDNGMVCYSSRAESGFLPWEKIFGKAFVQKWEAKHIGGFMDSMWYDGKMYWWKVDDVWVARNKDDSIMHLQNHGVSSKTSGKEVISRAGKILCAVQDARKVDYAAPLLFEKGEIVDINGEKVLNISRREAMVEADVPDPGNTAHFPWIWDFITNIFVQPDGTNHQMDYFLAWFQRLWTSARAKQLFQGQMLVLAGSAGQGKTFMSRCIIGAALGGSVDASDILQGKTNFNKQAAETCIWRVDDAAGSANRTEALKFGDTLKKHVANPIAVYHPKFRDAVEFPWRGRIVLTCNTDPNSLAILPSLDNTFEDKIMMLKFGSYMPHFKTSHEHEAMVANELPFFLAWLKQWQAPASVLGQNNRFGVISYHHKELVDASQEGDSATSLVEILETWRQGEVEVAKCDPEIKISSSQLLGRIREMVSGGPELMRNYSTIRLGRELRAIKPRYSPLTKISKVNGITTYVFSMKTKLE